MIDNRKNEIVNIDLPRMFIKTFINSGKNPSIILQISENEGVFIDCRFVRTDNYTLNANVGINPNFEYSITALNYKSNNYKKVSGNKLISMIEEFNKKLAKI